jgi:hypothetical protein
MKELIGPKSSYKISLLYCPISIEMFTIYSGGSSGQGCHVEDTRHKRFRFMSLGHAIYFLLFNDNKY